MSLNWKEIQLILSEIELEGCKIQNVIQNSFHSLTWEMYHRDKGRFLLYTEVGTQQSRIHTISQNTKTEKTKKLQRFIQFTRKNVDGSVIESVSQLPYDRCVILKCNNHGRLLNIVIRLYSGPGANIIVTDENFRILDLLLRRPNRDEISDGILKFEYKDHEDKEYEIRPYEGCSFNLYIEKSCGETQKEDLYLQLTAQIQQRKDRELAKIENSLNSARTALQNNRNYEEIKKTADILSANAYMIKKGDSSITVTDYENGSTLVISLNKSILPGDNVTAYYDKYQKAKGSYLNAEQEIERLLSEYDVIKNRFDKVLDENQDKDEAIRKMKALLEKTQVTETVHEGPGIRCSSGGFDIIAGRNAKENDELLRHWVTGNDYWLHTRDFPGGYVFIKFKKNKTVPLEVLLDAANLAVLFSKGRNSSQVDLYYTQVRYLRRAKNGKTGLVLPTQEKNLTIKPDKSRIRRLLPEKDILDEQ